MPYKPSFKKMNWSACLSHKIFPHIEKGWPDRDIFYWGLAEGNTTEIKTKEETKDDYWFVDVGYIGDQIHRYPEPKILTDNTHFRLVKNGIHNAPDDSKTYKSDRFDKLNIEVEDWKQGGDYILLCPSSPTVTNHMNGKSYEQWIRDTKREIQKHTDRPIKLREKPRPGNKFWGTDIKDDLKDAYLVVTNFSLSAIDALVYGKPVFTDKRHIAASVAETSIEQIDAPLYYARENLMNWFHMVAYKQFTLKEIEEGLAYSCLKEKLV